MLKTPRLDIYPLSPAQLELFPDRPEALEHELGLPISRGIVSDVLRRAIRMKLAKLSAADPSIWDWLTYWLVVIREDSFGAGLFGYKGFPDSNGEAEIGYGIDPACRGKGYATEALLALVEWAFREPACRAVVARDVLRTNQASRKVLVKAGFSIYEETGETLDFRIVSPATGG
jgi:RimJ/RimL family protein N-acetyltransferase